ncbi:Putative lectin [Phytophthora palmivora]|uniref:Lectin n=1 Tax=Phytophthora palmivora TaxID=4796 RepID=A0A2P4Y6W6_9STRA|nr:Putative lectin [Phytophthora palmivora]
MKFFALTAVLALSAVNAAEQASIHLRIHGKDSCTITNESQCNGQNWTGSTCCADPNYECRWSDDGQNVQRCQKKSGGTTGNPGTGGGGSVGDWGDCTGGKKCSNPTSVCVRYSNYYSQCKPGTLPAGELCGQNDGTNVWMYDKCPSNQKCVANGSDFRCTNKKHHHHHKEHDKGWCTITNESQCDGQNWTGSTCCADSSYECRWSDDGQNVKRCQKKWY